MDLGSTLSSPIRLAAVIAAVAAPSAVHAQAPSAPVAASPSPAAASAPAAKPVEQAHKPLPGYLGPGGVPDAAAILPPPPAPGSAAEALDRSIFVETRKLQGTPRWTLATSDAVPSPTAVLAGFGCAMGVELGPRQAPNLLHLLTRVGADGGSIVERAKSAFKRPRPFLEDAGPICVERTDDLAKSSSYPSGHTTLGWAYGLILAELDPARATQILEHARAYGESRVVCGVHYASDVEAGRTVGAALVARLHANQEFETDLAAAQKEVAVSGAAGAPVPSATPCAVVDQADAHRPWPVVPEPRRTP